MTIRNFTGADISVLADMWQKDMPFITVTREYFLHNVVFERSFSADGIFIAEENGIPEGFIITVCRRVPVTADLPIETERGWISGFCVPDRSKVNTVGRVLIEKAEQYLRDHDRKSVSTGFSPHYFTQGIEENLCPEYASLFTEMGYSSGRSYSLKLNLDDYLPDPRIAEKRAALSEQGFYVGPLKDRYLLSLLDAKAHFSSGNWSYEFKYRIEELDFDCIRICALGDEVVGVAACYDRFAPEGRFGPFGVSPEMRENGIGAVLLDDAISEMKRRGFTKAWMQWVGDHGPAYHLYTKVGFTKNNTYLTFSKQL